MAAKRDYSEALARVLRTHMGVRDKDVRLIRLYARDRQDSIAWEMFFKTVRVESEPYVFNYMLTRLGARFGWKEVPADLVPRLQGVRKKFTVKNAVLLMNALKLLRVLARQEAPLLMVRGGAMRLGLLPDVPQKMTDVDVVVPPANYDGCRAAAVAAGYEEKGFTLHSVALTHQGEQCVDLHYCVFKANVQGNEPTELIRARGSQVTRNGVTFTVPSPEDMFLHVMVNAVDNYLSKDRGKGPITWLADCIDLSERYALSYPTVVAHAREYGVLTQLQMAVALMRSLLPDSFVELYALADVAVSKRLYRRVRLVTRYVGVPVEEVNAYAPPRHLAYSCGLMYSEYLSLYGLEDDPHEVATGFVAYLRKRLAADERVAHVWEIPSVFLRHARMWQERKHEVS